jgi:hypothetical protein
MITNRFRSLASLALSALAMSGVLVAESTAVVSAGSMPAVPLACTHPGFRDRGGSGDMVGTDIGIRSGPELPCPLNGSGSDFDALQIWCYVNTPDGQWVFIVDEQWGNGARGWVPARWVAVTGGAYATC